VLDVEDRLLGWPGDRLRGYGRVVVGKRCGNGFDAPVEVVEKGRVDCADMPVDWDVGANSAKEQILHAQAVSLWQFVAGNTQYHLS